MLRLTSQMINQMLRLFAQMETENGPLGKSNANEECQSTSVINSPSA